MKKCDVCKSMNDDLNQFCTSCGADLTNITPENNSLNVSEKEVSSPIDSVLSFTKQTEIATEKPKSLEYVTRIKKNPVLIGSLIFVLFLVGIFGYNAYQQYQRQEYESVMKSTVSLMYNSASKAESLIILTLNTWYNAIFEVYDFETNLYTRTSLGTYYDWETAVGKLYNAASTKTSLVGLNSDQVKINSNMDKLRKPPRELESDYANLYQMYLSYEKIISAAIDPSGSYITFKAQKTSIISEFLLYYSLVK